MADPDKIDANIDINVVRYGDQSTKDNVIHTTKLLAEAGNLEFNTQYRKSPNSEIWEDKSHVLLQDNHSKSLLKFIDGGLITYSFADTSINSDRNKFESVKGNAQHTYGGDLNIYAHGNVKILSGKHDTEADQAHEEIRGHLKEIQEAKIQTYQETEGQKVKCPMCNTKTAQPQDSGFFKSFTKFLKSLWPPYVKYPNKAISFIVGLVAPNKLVKKTAIAAKGGDNCKNPSCKDGLIETSAGKADAANKKSSEMMEQKQETIAELEKKLSASSVCEHHKGSFSLIVGSGKVNDLPAYAKGVAAPQFVKLRNSDKAPRSIPVPESVGSCIQWDSVPPDLSPGGEYHIVADNKVTINAGAHGINLGTNGHSEISAGSLNVVTSDGTLNLASKGKTVLKGANIKIDANDGSGDHGLEIDAKHTGVKGQLSVTGDLVVTGTITCNGNNSSPTFLGRDMMLFTDPASDVQMNTMETVHNSIFPIPNGMQATIWQTLNALNEKLSMLETALTNFELTIENLINSIFTAKTLVNLKAPTSNNGVPSGFALLIDATTKGPILGYSKGTIVSKTGGPCTGFVTIPPTFIPVWTHPHVHPKWSGNHTHAYSTLAYKGVPSINALNAMTPNPSHVPSPAQDPMGSVPGPKSMPDSCGGSGNFFVNAPATRNAQYGFNGSDAFGQNNYAQGTVAFTENGEMIPPPKLSVTQEC